MRQDYAYEMFWLKISNCRATARFPLLHHVMEDRTKVAAYLGYSQMDLDGNF